jgi:uncharacterized protein (DUF4415 family)
MKTNTIRMVTYTLDLNNLPPLTESQKAELAALATLSDDEIDFSDSPEVTDERWKNAIFYRPVKQQITARLDSDVLHWLKSQGKFYQSRMNEILRREMLAAMML